MEFIEKNNDALHASLEGLVQVYYNVHAVHMLNMSPTASAENKHYLDVF